ncbi:transposase [Streptomyces umbrinus]|uniref:Transposase n=1 Tax=Streptomyces umbrinus TaxID=67370 RepID=A0ABU0SLD7_9ACTN|nr:IS110 family transposase [Streptomyces umbrinus]MDQ1024308.1 transposase [Streptomyces umbrinus]
MSRIWVGIDSGKGHHHGLALDMDGKTLLSRRVANDEPELLKLIGDVLDLADGRHVTWAIDMTGGEPALMLALLVNHGQEALYIPGRLVNRASDGYRGEGRTDARDAYVIADQARMRRDLRPIRPGDEATIELKLLTGRRADLVEDRTRSVNRLRGTLLSMFPALERALDVTNTGPLKLLTGYQTPAAIRRTGTARLAKWPANHTVRNARALAEAAVEAAVEAAGRQHTAVPGEKTIAKLVHTLAGEVMALNEQISETDKPSTSRAIRTSDARRAFSVRGRRVRSFVARVVGRGSVATPADGPSGQSPICGKRETILLPLRATRTSS